MTDYTELVKALRWCDASFLHECGNCLYVKYKHCKDDCMDRMLRDAAAAIEALQAEVKFYDALAEEWKSLAENKERLLGLYRAEQSKNFYSAMDNNGRVIQNPCACMNIPVFPDSSESPNS